MRTTFVTLICGFIGLGGVTAAVAQEVIDLGAGRALFVDDHLIGAMEGATLKLHEPQPAGMALLFDNAWEGRYSGYVTVFHDEDRYRMYYRGLPTAGKDGSDSEVTCYAESDDGIHWTKPVLGLHVVDGFRENNVVLAGMAPYSHNFAPFRDSRPGVPEDARYKAIAGTSNTGLVAFASADGLNWRKLRDEPIITEGAFDSQNVAFWSEHEQRYVCYFRTWSEGGYAGIRTVSRSTSTDFLEWSAPEAMDFGGTPMEHLYTNQTTPYYRAPNMYVAIAARFMPGRRVATVEEAAQFGGEAGYSGDCSDAVLITSRGGNRYTRTFMEGFIRPGIGLENWTSRTNYPAWGIVPTGDEAMSLYVQHQYGQPAHGLQRYTLRPDGFVSVNAPYAGGELVTKPFTFSGTTLLLNYATSAAGYVKVEIQDAAGTPIAGHALADATEIIGNFVERPAAWASTSDVGALADSPIRLRFVMKDADLYSLRFE
jgi:hypothetical protein